MIARTVLLVGVLLFGAATVAQAESKASPGEAAFKKHCVSCHSLIPGMSTIAPDLHDVVGRKSGTVPDYRYSEALKAANITWTPEKLNEWLTSPHCCTPETEMSFPGLQDAKERAQIIEFLKHFTAKK